MPTCTACSVTVLANCSFNTVLQLQLSQWVFSIGAGVSKVFPPSSTHSSMETKGTDPLVVSRSCYYKCMIWYTWVYKGIPIYVGNLATGDSIGAGISKVFPPSSTHGSVETKGRYRHSYSLNGMWYMPLYVYMYDLLHECANLCW